MLKLYFRLVFGMIDICAKRFCNISKDKNFVGDTKVCPVTDKKTEKFDYFLV